MIVSKMKFQKITFKIMGKVASKIWLKNPTYRLSLANGCVRKVTYTTSEIRTNCRADKLTM